MIVASSVTWYQCLRLRCCKYQYPKWLNSFDLTEVMKVVDIILNNSGQRQSPFKVVIEVLNPLYRSEINLFISVCMWWYSRMKFIKWCTSPKAFFRSIKVITSALWCFLACLMRCAISATCSFVPAAFGIKPFGCCYLYIYFVTRIQRSCFL